MLRQIFRAFFAMFFHSAKNQNSAFGAVYVKTSYIIGDFFITVLQDVRSIFKRYADMAADRIIIFFRLAKPPDFPEISFNISLDLFGHRRREHNNSAVFVFILILFSVNIYNVQIVRPELKSPLRNTMGFVENKIFEAVVVFHSFFYDLDELFRAETFGRYIKERHFSAQYLSVDLLKFDGSQVAVKTVNVIIEAQPMVVQFIYLILHQGFQRSHHQRQTVCKDGIIQCRALE